MIAIIISFIQNGCLCLNSYELGMPFLFLSQWWFVSLKRNIDFNKALVAKLDWELAEGQDKLWI